MCINQFFKEEYNKEVVDEYISKTLYRHEFKLNNKRRLWHIENNKDLYRWAKQKELDI